MFLPTNHKNDFYLCQFVHVFFFFSGVEFVYNYLFKFIFCTKHFEAEDFAP